MKVPAPILLPALLGFAHGVNDCIAGFLIGSFSLIGLSNSDLFFYVLLYNVLAFGGQAPLAFLLDKWQMPRMAILASFCLAAMALASWTTYPLLAILFAGLGSAVFHISGGMLSLSCNPGKAESTGLFTGPGVIGLMLGGLAAIKGIALTLPLLVLVAFLLLMMIAIPLPTLSLQKNKESAKIDFEWHDLIMMVLLLAVAMRSVVWTIFQMLYQEQYLWLFWIAITAGFAKIISGFLADWLGWRRFAIGALSLSIPLLHFGHDQLWSLCLGVALTQSVTPLTLSAIWVLMPNKPAMATGLTLGLAIAAGGLLFFTPFYPFLLFDYWTGPLLFIVLILYAFTIGRIEKTQRA